MKNKKGFTLVELIAVIVILSLVMIIIIPSIQDALNGAKTGIGDINKKNLEDAGEVLATGIIYCDENVLEPLQTKYNSAISSCEKAKEALNEGMIVSVNILKEMDIFSDDAENCSGALKVQANVTGDNPDYKITVTFPEDGENAVNCKK